MLVVTPAIAVVLVLIVSMSVVVIVVVAVAVLLASVFGKEKYSGSLPSPSKIVPKSFRNQLDIVTEALRSDEWVNYWHQFVGRCSLIAGTLLGAREASRSRSRLFHAQKVFSRFWDFRFFLGPGN